MNTPASFTDRRATLETRILIFYPKLKPFCLEVKGFFAPLGEMLPTRGVHKVAAGLSESGSRLN